jgi:dual specificity tyrosine-phosphorylation-regulated kinase 2/3/4
MGNVEIDPVDAAAITFESLEKPLKPGAALKSFQDYLLDYEKGEILDYKEIYFLGIRAKKTKLLPGFDDEKGFYTLLANDHISYRFEMLELLGKGSFG